MHCRGVRGATTVTANTSEEILNETRRLLALMIRLNNIQSEDVASAIFTLTSDLNAEFPAMAARQLGWLDVPLICTHEVHVPVEPAEYSPAPQIVSPSAAVFDS